MKKLLFFVTVAFFFACSEKGKICTEEFRMITVEITDAQNEPVEPDDFYVIKIQSGDTVFSKNNPSVNP
jgi:hypothetical protein